MRIPRISVIMPVFNAQDFISASIQSILNQSHDDFELVVINDGSTDGTSAILNELRDSRLKVVSLSSNFGLAAARIAGFHESRGKYIAWLDADDTSHRDRLVLQEDFLERNQEFGLCGSWVRVIGQDLSTVWRYPRYPEYIRAHMIFDDPFATSSVMMRREVLESATYLFSEEFAPAEDYDLWERLARKWPLTNLSQTLTTYRIHGSQTSQRLAAEQLASVKRIQVRQLDALGIHMDEDEWRVQRLCGVDWGINDSDIPLSAVHSWIDRIEKANRRSDLYDPATLRSVLRLRLLLVRQGLFPSFLRRLPVRAHVALRW